MNGSYSLLKTPNLLCYFRKNLHVKAWYKVLASLPSVFNLLGVFLNLQVSKEKILSFCLL